MNIMTLAIAEMRNSSDYQAIGLDIDTQNIISLNGITKDNVIVNGQPVWDIGAVTAANVEKMSDTKLSYYADNNAKMLRPFDREDFKKVLKMKVYGKSDFFVNEKTTYEILRIQRVIDIYEKDKKHYVKVTLYAKSNNYHNRVDENGIYTADGNYIIQDILIKDLRWINYWNWAIKTGVYEEKRVIYRKQFNKVYHDKFIVMYRHKFNNNSTYCWATGLHLL